MKQKNKQDNYNNCQEESKKKDDESWEEYARRYLNWIASNEPSIKHAISKNTTWDEEIYESVFPDVLVQIYDYISKKQKEVENFKMFVFISLKWRFIQQQNKKRQAINTTIPIDSIDREDGEDYMEREEYLNRVEEYLNWLFEQINDTFDSATADTFIIYYRLKAEKSQSVSYKKLATICGVSEQEISRRIQTVKKWIKDNKEILEYKKNKMLNI